MQNSKEFLKNIGLTEKEISVYLNSLKLGEQSASIIAKKVSLPRSSVSFIFESLVKKGFASKRIKGKTNYYLALPPDSLEYLLLDNMAAAKKMLNDYKEALPELQAQQASAAILPSVRFFEGYEGLCRMLDDFCAKDETVLYISGHNMMHPEVRNYVYQVYLPISDKHKNKNKIILTAGTKSREYEKKAAKSYDEFIFTDPKYKFPLTTAIYGDKIAYWSYDPKDMTGVIIQNPLIAANTRSIFYILKEFFKKVNSKL